MLNLYTIDTMHLFFVEFISMEESVQKRRISIRKALRCKQSFCHAKSSSDIPICNGNPITTWFATLRITKIHLLPDIKPLQLRPIPNIRNEIIACWFD